MPGPWEKYAQKPDEPAGPWAKYRLNDAVADEPASPLRSAIEGAMSVPGAIPRVAKAGLEAGFEAGSGEGGPAAAGALAAGALTGGAGLIPGALAVGAGAMGGEGLRQALSDDDVSGEKMVQRGLEYALMDLGVGSAFKLVKAALPMASQIFAKVPSESVKRAIENPKILMLKGDAKLAVESKGVAALDKVQSAVELARHRSGVKVDGALRGLEKITGGRPVVNLNPMLESGLEQLTNRGAFDQTSGVLMKREVALVEKIMDRVPDNGAVSAREAVNLRRQLDDLITYKAGGVQKVSSDAGEAVVRSMANRLRQAIGEAAEAVGFPALSKANAEHSRMASLYEEMGEVFKTASDSTLARADRFDRAANLFYKGGIRKNVLDEAAGKIPYGREAVNELLDAAAAKSFTEIPSTAPSSLLFNLFRMVGSPRAIGAGIKSGGISEGAARAAGMGAVSAVDSLMSEPRRRR
jgi:hypothetical protein